MILVSTFFMVLASDGFTQDPEFTQFYASPLYTNPAMAGTGKCNRGGGGARAAINYRNQWPGMPGGFAATTAFSFDRDFDAINGGLGVLAMRDVAGEGLLTTTSISGIYSYRLDLSNKWFMRFGLEGQMMQRSIDWSRLRWEDQISATRGFVKPTKEPTVTNTITTPNFSSGMLLYSERFYAGAAVHNMIEPVQSFYGDNAYLPRRYTVHFGSVIPLDRRQTDEHTFSPNALFMAQGQFTQLNVGFYVNRGPLVTGVWFRQTFGEANNADAVMLLLGFRKDKFKFGYSYDMTVDSKRPAARGSHEISTTLEWCPRKRSTKPRLYPCPSF
jgi:type IX secretion system PorP/SprF family membrane protein